MTKLIISESENLDENLKIAAQLLASGKVVAFPTETVYGLGAHVFNESAIERIHVLKNRPKEKKGMIVHLGKIDDVHKVAKDIPQEFYLLAEKFFPGPLTLILKKKPSLPVNISSDDTIAVRMPNNPITLKMLEYLEGPIIGTSANISNEKSPICAKEVLNVFENKIDALIDDGICLLKTPSTVLSLVERPFRIYRQGSITATQIKKALNSDLDVVC